MPALPVEGIQAHLVPSLNLYPALHFPFLGAAQQSSPASVQLLLGTHASLKAFFFLPKPLDFDFPFTND